MKRLLIALSTRKCRGCSNALPHTHHLTRIGRRSFVRLKTLPPVTDRCRWTTARQAKR